MAPQDQDSGTLPPNGTVTLDLLLGSQHLRAEAWLALAKLDSAVAEQLRKDVREKK